MIPLLPNIGTTSALFPNQNQSTIQATGTSTPLNLNPYPQTAVPLTVPSGDSIEISPEAQVLNAQLEASLAHSPGPITAGLSGVLEAPSLNSLAVSEDDSSASLSAETQEAAAVASLNGTPPPPDFEVPKPDEDDGGG